MFVDEWPESIGRWREMCDRGPLYGVPPCGQGEFCGARKRRRKLGLDRVLVEDSGARCLAFPRVDTREFRGVGGRGTGFARRVKQGRNVGAESRRLVSMMRAHYAGRGWLESPLRTPTWGLGRKPGAERAAGRAAGGGLNHPPAIFITRPGDYLNFSTAARALAIRASSAADADATRLKL